MDLEPATEPAGGGRAGNAPRAAPVAAMPSALSRNEQWLAMLQTLVGGDADLAPARAAFDATPGDFDARFAAAVQALVARQVSPEVFIEIPAQPQRLSRSELDALVRPVAAGHLRSQPTKGELLEQVELIRQRQERRPAWLPRADREGRPLPSPDDRTGVRPTVPGDGAQARRATSRAGFPELGGIDVPASDDDRPELVAMPGGMGELEVVLHTVLATGRGPAGVLRIDAESNEALIPGSGRRPRPAAQDAGVAGELLATTPTLAGVPVSQVPVSQVPVAQGSATQGAVAQGAVAQGAVAQGSVTQGAVAQGPDDVVRAALAAAADWRYSPRWLLDTWDHGSGADAHDGRVAALATARAAVAGWADEAGSGLVAVVYGGVLRGDDGLFGVPGPLHSFVLCATRAADGTDAIGAVHRAVLSCPGKDWCHRGGCGVAEGIDLTRIITGGDAAEAGQHVDWAARTYGRLYGAGPTGPTDPTGPAGPNAAGNGSPDGDPDRHDPDGGGTDGGGTDGGGTDAGGTDAGHPGTAQAVLDHAYRLLTGAGWLEVERSTWEGGLEDLLVHRGQHCLRVSYDPVTRQLKLTDGRPLLEYLVQDGAMAQLPVVELPLPARPQVTMLGLHPHADGTLLGPGSPALVQRQLAQLLHAAAVG